MLHSIATDQGACAAETCFTVDGQGSFFMLTDSEEVMQDLLLKNHLSRVYEILRQRVSTHR
jgi:hypothetical protein